MENSRFFKNASLINSLILLIIPFTKLNSLNSVNSLILKRLLYPFLSTNVMHAMLNVYCLLGLVFVYRIKAWIIITAYLIAVTAPSPIIANTVGLSGVIYAALGIYTLHAVRICKYLLFIALSVALMACLGSMYNTALHIYCFLIGSIISVLHHGR